MGALDARRLPHRRDGGPRAPPLPRRRPHAHRGAQPLRARPPRRDRSGRGGRRRPADPSAAPSILGGWRHAGRRPPPARRLRRGAAHARAADVVRGARRRARLRHGQRQRPPRVPGAVGRRADGAGGGRVRRGPGDARDDGVRAGTPPPGGGGQGARRARLARRRAVRGGRRAGLLTPRLRGRRARVRGPMDAARRGHRRAAGAVATRRAAVRRAPLLHRGHRAVARTDAGRRPAHLDRQLGVACGPAPRRPARRRVARLRLQHRRAPARPGLDLAPGRAGRPRSRPGDLPQHPVHLLVPPRRRPGHRRPGAARSPRARRPPTRGRLARPVRDRVGRLGRRQAGGLPRRGRPARAALAGGRRGRAARTVPRRGLAPLDGVGEVAATVPP